MELKTDEARLLEALRHYRIDTAPRTQDMIDRDGLAGQYILDLDGRPVRCPSLLMWAEWFDKFERRVVDRTVVGNRINVSTVFLGIDHGFGRFLGRRDERPILWETMSFWRGEFLEPETIEITHENGERSTYETQRPLVAIPDNQERYMTHAAAVRGHRRHVSIAERVLAELDAKRGAGYGLSRKSK